MKIDGTNPLLEPQSSIVDRPPVSSGSNSQQIGPTESADGVSVTVNSTVESLASQLGNLPDVREERVAALRQVIEAGQYVVSDAQIAKALQTQLLGTGSSQK